MASAVAEQHICSKYLFQVWDHDPGTTNAIVATPDGGTTDRYVDMRDYERFAAIALATVVAAGGLTKLEIVASSDTAGADLTVIKDSGTIAADSALNDWAILECSADELAQAGAASSLNLRYVAARLTNATNTDECVVIYFGISNRPHLDLTPATTIA
jgi:hypothetical protein